MDVRAPQVSWAQFLAYSRLPYHDLAAGCQKPKQLLQPWWTLHSWSMQTAAHFLTAALTKVWQ